MNNRVVVAGFGGQGVLLIGQMLTYAAMYDGKEVTWMPSYGPEMRGGTASCTVCISDQPIMSPIVTKCEVLVAMNGPSLEKYEDMLVSGGHIFLNETLAHLEPRRNDIITHYVKCTEIAEKEIGNTKMANMVMLGALIRTTGIVSLDVMDKVFRKTMTGKKEKFIPDNLRALEAWKE